MREKYHRGHSQKNGEEKAAESPLSYKKNAEEKSSQNWNNMIYTQMAHTPMIPVHIRFPKKLSKAIQKLVASGHYATFSEFVRMACNEKITKEVK